MKSTTVRRNLFVFALAAALAASSLAGLRTASAAALRQKSGATAQKPAPQRGATAQAPAGPIAEAVPLVSRVLPNGLEVIVLEDHSVPLVTVELAVRNGSFTEPPELNGLSHLYEHMFFKVSPERGKQADYLQNIDALGIVYNGATAPQDAFRGTEVLSARCPRRPKDPFAESPVVEPPPLPKSEGEIIRKPVQNIVVMIGWQGPSIGKDDAATYAADVFSFILRQPNSRFQRALLDTGLATNLAFGYYTQRNVGPINLIIQTTPDKARAAVRAAYNEIAHFNDPDYFTDEELESAKALLEAEDLYSREKLSDYSHVISFWWSTTGLDYFRGYLRRLRATSRSDISRYVTTYLQGKPHVGLAMMSDESLKASGLTENDLIGNEAARAAGAAGR